MIPDRKECIKIMEGHGVVAEVIEHCKQVSTVAVFLAKELKKAGENVDVKLVEAAALLHDLDKIETKSEPDKHGIVAHELLKKDFPEVADLVPKHCFSYLLDSRLKTWEEKILNYSDTRVLYDEIVLREERHEDAKKRYPDETGGRREEAEKNAAEIEKEIFKKIGLKPHNLAKAIDNQIIQQKKLKSLKRKQKQENKQAAESSAQANTITENIISSKESIKEESPEAVDEDNEQGEQEEWADEAGAENENKDTANPNKNI